MKLLTKLEKSKIFWYLLGLSLLFFLLRLPSLIEPNWYGDEGIYQSMGQAVRSGRMLYTEIWDNKPPLLYITYALFNGDQFLIRILSLVSGLLSVLALFKLSQMIFRKVRSSIISTSFFALLFGVPLIEGNIANAENFMLLPIITAGVLVYKLSIKNHTLNPRRYTLIIAGLLLGIAFLFKIVAVFDFAAFCVYLLVVSFPDRFSFSGYRLKAFFISFAKRVYPLLLGFIIPVIITMLYFFVTGGFSDFMRATFGSNVNYVGYANKLIIPQGMLIFKFLLLGGSIAFTFWQRKQLTKTSIFVLLWFAFSLFSTYFSGRPYTHYALMSLPAVCLLLGLLIETTKARPKTYLLILLICTVLTLNKTFKFNLGKTVRYYNNAISFVTGTKDTDSYREFFDRKTLRDYELASFIKTHTNSTEQIFIWGDSAQIYALSGKLPPGRYTVSYHIRQYENALEETQAALNKTKPKYIILLNESQTFPFNLTSYGSKMVFRESSIYERRF